MSTHPAPIVRLRVSAKVLQEMLSLGDRLIIGAWMVEGPTVVFEVEALDAPAGTTDMEPVYQRSQPGNVTMIDPGWHRVPWRPEIDATPP